MDMDVEADVDMAPEITQKPPCTAEVGRRWQRIEEACSPEARRPVRRQVPRARNMTIGVFTMMESSIGMKVRRCSADAV